MGVFEIAQRDLIDINIPPDLSFRSRMRERNVLLLYRHRKSRLLLARGDLLGMTG